MRDYYNVTSDYLGLWNERPQGSVDYVITLRNALDTAGFRNVGITIEATWQELVDQIAVNASFNASIVAASKHYPCNETSAVAIANHKRFVQRRMPVHMCMVRGLWGWGGRGR